MTSSRKSVHRFGRPTAAGVAPPRRMLTNQLQHEPVAREPEEMQHSVHYKVDIHCGPCPEGAEAEIAQRLRTAFPVTNCRNTPTGLALRLNAGHQYAYGALRDFADLIADTLTRLGISMTSGVVRLVTRGTPGEEGVWHRVQDATAALGRIGPAAGAGNAGAVLLQGIAVRSGPVRTTQGGEQKKRGRSNLIVNAGRWRADAPPHHLDRPRRVRGLMV